MRRYLRSMSVIVVLVVIGGLVLGFQTIDVGGFERGADTPLGLSLGLELQGGSHLEYRAVPTDPITGEILPPNQDQMDSVLRIIERRVNASGLGDPIIQQLGSDRVLIQLPGIEDSARAKSIIGETATLLFKHRTLNVARDIETIAEEDILTVSIGPFPTPVAAAPAVAPEGAEEPAPSESETTLEIGVEEPAPDEAGTESAPDPGPVAEPLTESEPDVSGDEAPPEATELEAMVTETEGADPEPEADAAPEGPPALLIEFTEAGAQEFEVLLERLTASLQPLPGGDETYPSSLVVALQGDQTRTLNIPSPFISRVPDTDQFAIALLSDGLSPIATDVASAREIFGDDLKVTFREMQGRVDEDIGLTGDDLASAYPGQHSGTGLPIVNLEFNSEGARKFGELTAEIVDTTDRIAIFLDDTELIAPVVTSVITGGAAFIQGRDFTPNRVRDIALLLESGRLPTPIELEKERNVDATLGADSLSKSVVAGAVGLALVLLFMVLYYRVPGVIAALALIIYATLLLTALKLLPVTLNLSGVAAAILSVGMAVDANVLIFERMKDELRLGRTLLSAINIGFNRAWPAIRDGNVSTLLTCGVLYYFGDALGATVVKGFAITLFFGVGISMFSAIVVTRTLLRLLTVTPLAGRPHWFLPAGAGFGPQTSEATHSVQRA